MNPPRFDEYIAIDWSGAARGYDGISVARCRPGRAAPKLIKPRGTRWTRREIAEWLERAVDGERRLLIGFDFAFGFPFEPGIGYLGGRVPHIDEIFALWTLVEAKSGGEPDFGCLQFVNDPEHASLFWTQGPRPADWIERKRRAELACAEATRTRPDTLYKLLHSKQVGKASITGIRVLNHVRRSKGERVSIWPFEPPRNSVMIEIYPTIFRKEATGSVAKLRTKAELDSALARLGSQAMPDGIADDLSDHDTDALLSAAGLRSIASDPSVWTPAEASSSRVRREGWIFGVGAAGQIG